jgi:hypothetical protein
MLNEKWSAADAQLLHRQNRGRGLERKRRRRSRARKRRVVLGEE